MTTFLEKIKAKIINKISTEEILLVDNSASHSKHKSFDPNRFHLKLIIKSKQLKKMNKIDAHKVVFSALKDEMKEKIHALEIKIK